MKCEEDTNCAAHRFTTSLNRHMAKTVFEKHTVLLLAKLLLVCGCVIDTINFDNKSHIPIQAHSRLTIVSNIGLIADWTVTKYLIRKRDIKINIFFILCFIRSIEWTIEQKLKINSRYWLFKHINTVLTS